MKMGAQKPTPRFPHPNQQFPVQSLPSLTESLNAPDRNPLNVGMHSSVDMRSLPTTSMPHPFESQYSSSRIMPTYNKDKDYRLPSVSDSVGQDMFSAPKHHMQVTHEDLFRSRQPSPSVPALLDQKQKFSSDFMNRTQNPSIIPSFRSGNQFIQQLQSRADDSDAYGRGGGLPSLSAPHSQTPPQSLGGHTGHHPGHMGHQPLYSLPSAQETYSYAQQTMPQQSRHVTSISQAMPVPASPAATHLPHTAAPMSLTPLHEPTPAPTPPPTPAQPAAGYGNAPPPPQVGDEDEDGQARNPGELRHALDFITKIKDRFDNDMERYKSFLKILHFYRQKKLTIREVYAEVMQLFEGHADLLEEFRHFLPDPKPADSEKQGRDEDSDSAVTGASMGLGTVVSDSYPTRAARPRREPPPPPAKPLVVEGTDGTDLFSRTKRKLKGGPQWAALVKAIHLFNVDILTRFELSVLIHDVLGRHPELEAEFRTALAVEDAWESDEDVSDGDAAPPAATGDEIVVMGAISAIDFSESKQCGPSYRTLPPRYRLPPCSGRSDFQAKLLNDVWLSVPLGNETDTSFKNSRKNQYEDILFRCEDERFEMDMAISSVASCIKFLERAQKKLDSMDQDERTQYRLGKLPPLHSRTIRRVYGSEKGNDVLALLADSPVAAVGVVLTRLREVIVNLEASRSDAEPTWRDLFARNLSKSLDHRSFYFKQADRKFISARGLLSEMKEAVDTAEGGSEATLLTDMSDHSVHRDIAARVWLATRKHLNVADSTRLEALWASLVRIFFDVRFSLDVLGSGPSHPQFADSDMIGDCDEAMLQRSVKDKERVFFGNNAFYVFFRLYGILFDRLKKAKALSAKSSAVDTNGLSGYDRYLASLDRLINNLQDVSQYEDECRAMMGSESYELFTLDKVIINLVRQPVAMQTGSSYSVLFGHFTTYMTDPSLSVDMYQRLCDDLAGDDNYYRIEYSGGQLRLTWLDPSAVVDAVEAGEAEEYATWLSSAACQPSLRLPQNILPLNMRRRSRVFLLRNARRARTWLQPSPVASVDGLMCKVAIRSYKMSFVAHSEDLFWRGKFIHSSPEEKEKRSRDDEDETEHSAKRRRISEE